MVENKAFETEESGQGDVNFYSEPQPINKSQPSSIMSKVVIVMLGAFVVISVVGLVVVVAVHIQREEHWKREAESLMTEKADLNDNLKNKSSEISTLTTENAKLTYNLNGKTTEIAQLNDGLQKAKKEVADLKIKASDMDDMTSENDRLNKTLMDKNLEYDKVAAEKAQLTNGLQQAKDQIDQLEKTITGLDDQTKKLDGELTESKVKVQQLEDKIKSIPCQLSCEDVTLKEITIPGGTTKKNVSMDGDWIVIQRRKDGCQSFTQGWAEYKAGFGSPCAEYWLGLEAIHQLTKAGDHQLKIKLIERGTGRHFYAQYSTFKLESEADKYTLRVSGYSGNATDALTLLNAGSANGMKFSTYDSDNDSLDNQNCADGNGAGWWQNGCSNTNLNGRYGYGGWSGIVWVEGGRQFHSDFAEMKIKRK